MLSFQYVDMECSGTGRVGQKWGEQRRNLDIHGHGQKAGQLDGRPISGRLYTGRQGGRCGIPTGEECGRQPDMTLMRNHCLIIW